MSDSPLCTIYVDGKQLLGPTDVPLLEFLAANDIELPHICYHPQLGAPQTCDTCWLEVNGELQRGCSIKAREGLNVRVENRTSQAARREGIDRIAARHELYCSVCENNNGNCGVKTAVKQIGVPYQKYPFQKTPYEKDESHPFYVYDPDQCILCGRCVEACQNVQVTETLSIDWEREHPRVLWDGGEVANESSCVSCGHCVTVCPCNALMEKAMLGEAGPLTAWPDKVKRPAIDLIKTVEESTGFGWIMGLSEMDAAWRAPDVKRTKTVCTYCGVGCSFEVWTKDRKVLRIQPQEDGPANGISTCVKGKFGWGFVDSEARLVVGHLVVARQTVGHGTEITGTLHIVVTAHGIGPSAGAAAVAGNQQQIGNGRGGVGPVAALGHTHRPDAAHPLGGDDHVGDVLELLDRYPTDLLGEFQRKGLQTLAVLIQMIDPLGEELPGLQALVENVTTQRTEPDDIAARIRADEYIGTFSHLVPAQVRDDMFLPVQLLGALETGGYDRMVFRGIAADNQNQVGHLQILDGTFIATIAYRSP
jgi:formate hydrogenlyase subunit 6/NADH:ubiquinone oxidoreductase subunit I